MASKKRDRKVKGIECIDEDKNDLKTIAIKSEPDGTSSVDNLSCSDENEGTSGGESTFSSNMSLDVLAQVASDRLQIEPRPHSSKQGEPSPEQKKLTKRNVQAMDLLTLDQIINVSDKVLVTLFGELTGDEMKRHYKYKCQILPDDCEEIFSSFGNESRAKSQLLEHLRNHIKTLKSKSKEPGFEFLVEPLPARRKRLAADKAAEKRRRRHSAKFASKKSPHQNIFTAIRTDRPTMYDPRRKLNSSSNTNPAIHQVKKVLGKKSSGQPGKKVKVVKNEVEKMQVVLDDSGQRMEPSMTGCGISGIEESTASDVDVVATPPRDTGDSTIVEVRGFIETERKRLLEAENAARVHHMERRLYEKIYSCQPYHDHNYTNIFGLKNEGPLGTDGADTEDFDSVSSRTAGIKCNPQPTIENEDEGVTVKVENLVVSGEHTTHVPIVRISHFPEQTIEDDKLTQSQNYDFSQFKRVEIVDEHISSTDGEAETEEAVSTVSIPRRRKTKKVTAAWERKTALQCIRELRFRKKDEDELTCKICKDKSFTATATLMYHYRSHAGIKPFVCLICNTTFTRQHSLNYHMLIHNNQSRFTCKDCGRKFRHPSHFKEHLRRHTGETPFHCTDCPLRFKTRNTYKRHLKTRHGKLLTANGIRSISRAEFLAICDNSIKPEGGNVSEEEEDYLEDQGGTTTHHVIDQGLGEADNDKADVEEGEVEEQMVNDDTFTHQDKLIKVEKQESVGMEVLSASNKLLELCSQVVKQDGS